MSKHEAIMNHTFTTEEGIKLVAEMVDNRLRSLYIQFPGSGNRPIHLTTREVAELHATTGEMFEMLKSINAPGVPESAAATASTPMQIDYSQLALEPSEYPGQAG